MFDLEAETWANLLPVTDFCIMHPELRRDIPLRSMNSFGIDVNAMMYAPFTSVVELKSLIRERVVRERGSLILGGGSNILLRRDVDAVVLHNKLRGIVPVEETDTHFLVDVAAGETWHQFVMHCIRRGWAGVENLSLIPGSVGAAPIQNIGAYGVEVREVIDRVEALHVQTGDSRLFLNHECEFGYRESIFKTRERGQWIITSVRFKLVKRPVFRIEYGAIQEQLDDISPDRLTIKQVSDAVIRIRKSKLPDPVELGNAGSFFKNPEVPTAQFNRLKMDYQDIPCYPLSEDRVKIPAGWLIERAGWKGKRVGNCGMHASQALVLVNYGGATGDELFRHACTVQDSVKEQFGIELEREVNIIPAP